MLAVEISPEGMDKYTLILRASWYSGMLKRVFSALDAAACQCMWLTLTASTQTLAGYSI